MKARASARPAGDRRKTVLYLTLAVIAIAIIVAVGYASRVPTAVTQGPTAPAAIKVGSTAPEFDVSTTAGAVDLKTMQAPVLLEVFATWCPHCQHETAVLNDLYKKYSKQIQFVAVSGSPLAMDYATPESQADVLSFAQHYNVQYPVAFDPDYSVAKSYLQSGFPTIVVIDKAKKITYLGDGELPEATLAKAITGVL